MPSKRAKNPRNRYARSAKYSEYKTLQLLECFALDLSIRDAARRTRMTERTVRDRYADIRARLLPACLDVPGLFNRFGQLLLDPDGNINPTVLEAMFYYAQSQTFKNRMARRYPQFRTVKDPVLNHVTEMAIRRFAAMEPLDTNADFAQTVKRIFAASRSEAYLGQLDRHTPLYKAKQHSWRAASRRLQEEKAGTIRRFAASSGDRLFRDLKTMLRRDPM